MTGRFVLRVAGRIYSDWTDAELKRDLGEIAGSFTLEHDDQARAERGLPALPDRLAGLRQISPGQECRIEVDGELMLVGYVDEVQLELDGEQLRCSVSGRDLTGDLVDCSANPDGPAEYRGLTVLEIAERLCQPFGIKVRADAEVGAPLARYSLDASETVLSAIEKAARQRSLLVLSDGVGGLLLTRSGRRRAPAPLRMPGNVHSMSATLSWERRFSRYVVKGQTERPKPAGARAALDGTARPLQAGGPVTPAPAPAARPAARERGHIVMSGEARDPEVTRYRPRVWIVRTQSGMSSVDEQARWRMRTARGASDALVYGVVGWREGEENRLWRPNELVLVEDPYADFARDMLVAGVLMRDGAQGPTTSLRVVGPETYDRIDEADPHRQRHERQRQHRREARGPGDGTARPLQAGS